jgi:1,4-dihydroxy-2-naphthoate octaprenyltransferase
MPPETDGSSDTSATRFIFLLYCIVLGMTFAFVSYRFAFQPVGSEFLGLYLGAVTLPWSIVVMPALAVATPDLPWFNVLVLFACGVLNALLIHRASRRRTDQTRIR